MDDKNTVKLCLKGNSFDVYSHWKSVSIESALNNITRSFSVEITGNFPDKVSTIQHISVGDKVQVYIGDDLVLSGYVDTTPMSYGAKNISAVIAGRSKTGDLIDCTMPPKDTTIETNSTSWSNTLAPDDGSYETIKTNITKAVRVWKEVPTYQIIAELIAPYGIKLKITSRAKAKLSKKQNLQPDADKTVKDILRKLVTEKNILMYDDAFGDLVINTKNETKNNNRLILRLSDDSENNVLNAHADFDGSKIFTDYQFFGSTKGSTACTGKSTVNVKSSYSDNTIFSRKRYTAKQNSATASNDEITAKGEAEYQNAQFYKTTYTVQGWRQSNGDLWQINKLVHVVDELLDIDQDMLIQRVAFNLDNSNGMTTSIEVIPPQGVRNEEKEEKQSNTGSTKNVKSSSNSFSQFTVIGTDGKEHTLNA